MRHHGQHLGRALGSFISHSAAKSKGHALRRQPGGVLSAAAVTVQHPAGAVLAQQLIHFGVGFAVMHRDRQVQLLRQLQLRFKQVVLFLRWQRPMVVQPDFPHRDHSGVIKQGAHSGKLGPPVPVVSGHSGGVLLAKAFGVDAQRGMYKRIFVGQFQHRSGIAGMRCTFQHAHHAAFPQRPHHRIPVRIKLPGRIMRVGIEDVGHSFALTLNEEFAIRNCQTLFLISHY